ncbi:hypothetical protein [Entomomonas asaccharolytica]|uniref:Lipoprotein n=1 Tax=Entomomonas asaccharolytica TaxID=2785331 RepID=A0A974RXF3_9GAMM|nr:hypothetical protein [Entomomonas asaccharolytica]QQP84799.1 hypothetical protein JHT90_10345 [Entomomonas asaccharolytica]
MKKIIICIAASLLMLGCSSVESLHIKYDGYDVIKNRYDPITYDDRDYGVFFVYDKEQIRPQVLAVPLFACKVELSNNGQQQTKYIDGRVTPAIDNQYTYIAEIDFSFLNLQQEDRYKGYIFENDKFYVVNDPTCRIIYSGSHYKDYNTPTISIPKQDITKKRIPE